MAVRFDRRAVSKRVRKEVKKTLPIFAQQVLKDSNYFARFDSGQMVASSIRASNLKTGQLVWDTPYAKKVYYTGSPSKDSNPNASLMWFHKAKSQYLAQWIELVQRELVRRL